MGKWITIFVGIALLWALFTFGARPRAPEIQRDIETRSNTALSNAGYSEVTASADGRDVTLTGQVESAAAITAVADTVAEVYGVRLVHNAVGVAPPYTTRFCKADGTIVVAGDVPDAAARRRIAERTEDVFRRWQINDELTPRTGAAEHFQQVTDAALIELGQLDEGCINTTGQTVLIAGRIRGERAAAALRERMTALEAIGIDVQYDLGTPVLSEQAQACQQAANQRIARGEAVLFRFDSDELHEIGRQLLDEIVEISRLCPDVGLLVTGHTDAVGDRDYNVELSERRAQAVVAYLVERGMDAQRLSAAGLGFSQPVADNTTEAGRAANRRIEFRALED